MNPAELDKPIQQVKPHLEIPSDFAQYLVEETQWGIDYTFDATGNTEVMRAALEVWFSTM